MPLTVTYPDDANLDSIYTGFWINQSLGAFRGTTLTVNREVGGLIIAFLALFVGIASGSVWKIVRFVLHAAYATPVPQDGLHQQRQISLRNHTLAITAAVTMMRASVVWRKRASAVQRKTLPVVVAALLLIGISAVAGTFTKSC